MKELRYQTLHCHTTNSDGRLTYSQVLDACRQNEIGVVAFTDHDTLPSSKQVDELRRKSDHPTKFIFGVEITAGYPIEVEGKEPRLFHVVGLFVDPGNLDLIRFTRERKEVRRRKIKLRVAAFRGLGFDISEKDVFSQVEKEGIPSALNLVLALEGHRQNRKILLAYLAKMKKAATSDQRLKELYDEMFQDRRGDKQKYFNTFFSDDSPFKIQLVKGPLPSMDRVVRLIRRASGLAVLAHWSYDRDNFLPELLEKIVREKRLDGLETVYDLFLYKTKFWAAKFRLDLRFLKSLTKRYPLFESGGVDAHRGEDFKLFSQDKTYARRTVGLAEKILSLRSVDLKNSSLPKATVKL